jgi:hypothetical protein
MAFEDAPNKTDSVGAQVDQVLMTKKFLERHPDACTLPDARLGIEWRAHFDLDYLH